MNTEMLIWKGQLEEKKQAAKKLELSISGLRSSLRTELNPHVPVAEIDPEMVKEQAFELVDKLIRYRRVCEEIKAINRSLGIE